METSHINVSVNLNRFGRGILDLRIPVDETVQQLILNILDVSFISIPTDLNVFAIRVPEKKLVIFDTDTLANYPVASGDYIEII